MTTQEQEKQENLPVGDIGTFINQTRAPEIDGTDGTDRFNIIRHRFLRVQLSRSAVRTVWTKMGSMVGYAGDIKFTRERILEGGVKKTLLRGLTGEGVYLTKAAGEGTLYLADTGKKIFFLKLAGESLFVSGEDLLALEESVEWKITMLKQKAAGILSGWSQLFNVKLSGYGVVAIATRYDPLTLPVSPHAPVSTDPQATVAWSGSLEPRLKTDIKLKNLVGRGSGESIQMVFKGQGFVVIQPYEEINTNTVEE
ncbi:DUF124 domain-containing protein [Olavius algarvensis associated proteobacterium Delta 3]|nr:DUF124 domain-containing protein [Olavius algarvensis associated proteobacterium Delta 3]